MRRVQNRSRSEPQSKGRSNIRPTWAIKAPALNRSGSRFPARLDLWGREPLFERMFERTLSSTGRPTMSRAILVADPCTCNAATLRIPEGSSRTKGSTLATRGAGRQEGCREKGPLLTKHRRPGAEPLETTQLRAPRLKIRHPCGTNLPGLIWTQELSVLAPGRHRNTDSGSKFHKGKCVPHRMM